MEHGDKLPSAGASSLLHNRRSCCPNTYPDFLVPTLSTWSIDKLNPLFTRYHSHSWPRPSRKNGSLILFLLECFPWGERLSPTTETLLGLGSSVDKVLFGVFNPFRILATWPYSRSISHPPFDATAKNIDRLRLYWLIYTTNLAKLISAFYNTRP